MKQTDFIQKINKSPWQFYYTFAGGGSVFAADWHSIPGASSSVLAMYNNNSMLATDIFLGKKPESYVSEKVAIQLAAKAYDHATTFGALHTSIGLSFTGSLATKDEREGRKHRFRFCAYSFLKTVTISFDIKQGKTRAEEEDIVSTYLYILISNITGIRFTPPEGYNVDTLEGKYRANTYSRDETPEELSAPLENRETLYLIPGSFDPLQEAHELMFKTLADKFGKEDVFYECSVKNAEKGSINYAELQRRDYYNSDLNKEFSENILYSEAPLYLDKYFKFKSKCKNLVFAVGWDTWERIISPKYRNSFEILRKFDNVKFIVFNRANRLVKNVDYDEMCIALKESEEFHYPISSTEKRKNML